MIRPLLPSPNFSFCPVKTQKIPWCFCSSSVGTHNSIQVLNQTKSFRYPSFSSHALYYITPLSLELLKLEIGEQSLTSPSPYTPHPPKCGQRILIQVLASLPCTLDKSHYWFHSSSLDHFSPFSTWEPLSI